MKDVIIISVIAILSILPLNKNLSYSDNINENILWPAVRVTEKTGRVHAGCASFEYLSSKAFDNLDYIKIRENKVYILSGDAEIIKEEKNGTHMNIKLLNTKKDTVLELPYIYYLGYNIDLEYNGNIENLVYTESDKGFIQVKTNQDIQEGIIIVEYIGTNLMKISAVVSIISFTFMVMYACLYKKKEGN